MTAGQAVTVAYTDPTASDDASAVQDLAGNDAATFAAQAVTNSVPSVPTVESVALSDAGTDGAYGIGDTVSVTVTFTDSVDVAGVPQLDIDVAGSDKKLSYDSGTGTAALVFTGYTVAENEVDADGIEIAANELELGGGTIRKKGSTDVNATLTHAAVAAESTHRVDGVRPTLLLASTSADGTQIALRFIEALSSTTAPASAFTVTVDGSTATLNGAPFVAGTQTTVITLTTAVTAGQAVTVAYTDPTANNDANAVQDLAGNDAATFAAQTVTNTVAAVPTVASLALSDAGADGAYGIGDAVSVTVTFTDSVDVTGTPQLDIDVAGSDKKLSYDSGTGTDALVFTGYTVAENEVDADGIEIAENELDLNGGTIRLKGSTTVDATLTHAAVAAQSTHRVDGLRPTLLTTSPNEPKTSANGASIELTFSEALSATTAAAGAFAVEVAGATASVSGTPTVSGTKVTLTLTTAVTAGQAVTVAYTDPTANNDANAVQDLAGNDAATFAAQTVTNTVAAVPTVASLALSDAGADGAYGIGDAVSVTVTFTDSVDVTGTPQLDIDVAGSDKKLSYDSGTGTDALVFTGYTVAENEVDADGIGIAENELELGGGTIRKKGSTTVDATLTHAAVAAESTHSVDGLRPTLLTTSPNEPKTSANGASIELTFSETLSATTAAAGAFAVEVAGATASVSGTPTVSGTKVTLTLTTAVTAGQAVTVAYTDPTANNDANAVQDLAGNDAATFAARTVTNSVASTNANLRSLTLSGVTLSPTFTAAVTGYTAAVANSVASTTVEAAAAHASATIEYLDGSAQTLTDADAADGFQVALAVGADTIKVKVTAEDGVTEKTYTVVVTRQGPTVRVSLGSDGGEVKGEYPVFEGPMSGDPSALIAVRIPVELSEAPGRSVSIPLTTTHGTGAGADDYDVCVSSPSEAGGDCIATTEGYSAAMPEAITFAADETRMVIGLYPVDDAEAEGDETVTVAVGTPLPEGVEQGAGATVRVTILDNDGLTGRFAASAYQSTRHKGPGDRAQVVLEFSEAVAAISANTPSVQVTHGTVVAVREHQETGVSNGWILYLEPEGAGMIEVRLVAGQACAAGGICTSGGTMLQVVPPHPRFIRYDPPAMTVEDAEATEGTDANMEFTVELDRPAPTEITVDYATADDPDATDMAAADGDYTTKSGTLRFLVGDTAKTVSVPIINDIVEDDGETFRLVLSNAVGARLVDSVAVGTIRNTEALPLTASFEDMPASHAGAEFTFGLTFSEEVELSYRTLRDHAFDVTGGDVLGASRQAQGSNQAWDITVEPSGSDAVTITLPETTDCGATGAICTSDDRPLSHSLSKTVAGPAVVPALSVADASATEGDAVEFTVSLSVATGEQVTVAYATSGGTATSGTDFTADSGTLTFAANETSKTVSIATTEDQVNENDESFTLTLSSPTGATLADATATGTIVDDDSAAPLTASFSDMPASHTGAEFTFVLTFSEEVELSYRTLRDDAFDVSGGDVRKAQRREQGSNLGWNITVEPASASDTVTITLPETTDCNASGAICTADDRKLSPAVSDTVAPAASAGDSANWDAADDVLALLDGVTPDEASAALLGEGELSEAQLDALDRLGNGNGRYDLGDMLSWRDRCRRGEASCGSVPTVPGPVSGAALLAAAAAGRRGSSRRPKRRGSGRCRAGRPRYALAMLLAATMTWSCTDGSVVGPAAVEQEPGFLTVELIAPVAHRDIGVLLELEGPGIETVRAPGHELYQSGAPGRHQIVVAGSLQAGPLVQFRVPDRHQLPLYRIRILEVTGEDYELRDAGEYRAVITH